MQNFQGPPSRPLPHVVIVGGGFAGLRAAKSLRHGPVRLTLLDRTNHHLFQPLLYQVATAGLGGPDIASPLRKILRHQANATVLMCEVLDVDLQRRRLLTNTASLSYDYLVLAAGATHSYFGHDAWAVHAPGLKTLADALDLRQRILSSFEAAELEPDPERRQTLLSFVVIGAGPTGVEMAGAIAEMARHTLTREFRRFDPRQARIVLLDMASRVLPPYPESLSRSARRQLEHLGVEVLTSTKVCAIDEQGVDIGEGRINARTVIWAAGVKASRLSSMLGVPLDAAGRILVNPDLSIPGHPEAFAAGDIAAIRDDRGLFVPAVAPAAIQQGQWAARNILRLMAGAPTRAFGYRDKGTLATIGRSAAVAVLFGLRFSGVFAWLAWIFVHLLYLVGFRNRASVLLDWTWAYFTYQRSARLILPPEDAAAGASGGKRPAARWFASMSCHRAETDQEVGNRRV